MTQFFLVHFPDADEYRVTTMGNYPFNEKITRGDGWDDEKFKKFAIDRFNMIVDTGLRDARDEFKNQVVVTSRYIL